jgi:putative acetyltransferase
VHITTDDLTAPEVVAFLEGHVAQLRAESPPGSSHALDLDGLRTSDVTFWTARLDGELVGCAALKRLDREHAELKSMRTTPHRTRQGVASRLLAHVLDEARGAGFTRISLETGSQSFFLPARTLYAAHGFVECLPFGSYRLDPSSVFLTRPLV